MSPTILGFVTVILVVLVRSGLLAKVLAKSPPKTPEPPAAQFIPTVFQAPPPAPKVSDETLSLRALGKSYREREQALNEERAFLREFLTDVLRGQDITRQAAEDLKGK